MEIVGVQKVRPTYVNRQNVGGNRKPVMFLGEEKRIFLAYIMSIRNISVKLPTSQFFDEIFN